MAYGLKASSCHPLKLTYSYYHTFDHTTARISALMYIWDIVFVSIYLYISVTFFYKCIVNSRKKTLWQCMVYCFKCNIICRTFIKMFKIHNIKSSRSGCDIGNKAYVLTRTDIAIYNKKRCDFNMI